MTQSAAVEDRSSEEEKKRRSRIFWRFWTGSTISGAGTAVTSVAMPLLAVLVLHVSSFQVGTLTAATDAAWLLIGLPAGVIVERFPLRGTQVVMDVVRAVALASVPLAYLMHGLSFVQLVLVALITGFASVVFDVGNSTFIVSVVSKDELAKRNSLSSGSNAFVQLGGPSLGGVLLQLAGGPVCLLIDSISYCASAILLWSLPRPQREPVGSRSVSSALAMIRGGWWYTVRHKVIGPCMAAAALVNFTSGALMALIPLYLVRTLHVNVALVGALEAAQGAGSLIGAAAAVTLASRLGNARAVLAASMVSAAAMFLLPVTGTAWGLALFAIGSAGFAFGVTVLSILTRTYRQSTTPREILPRVMATVRFVSWGVIPIGSVLAGLLASLTSNRDALLAACIPAVLTVVVLWSGRVGRQRDWADYGPQTTT